MNRGGHRSGSTQFIVFEGEFDLVVLEAKEELGAGSIRTLPLSGAQNLKYREAFLPSRDGVTHGPWLTDNLQVIETVLHPESIPNLDTDYPVVKSKNQTVLVYFAHTSWSTSMKRWFRKLFQ